MAFYIPIEESTSCVRGFGPTRHEESNISDTDIGVDGGPRNLLGILKESRSGPGSVYRDVRYS